MGDSDTPEVALEKLPSEISEKETVVDENETTETAIKEEPDLYSYTKLNDFTSEIFKIELQNLPNYVGYAQIRKLLNTTLKLNPRKVKAIGRPPSFVFITFKNEDDRENALQKLNGYTWKGKSLFAKKANPAVDPMAQKRKDGASEDCPKPKKAKTDDVPIELKLKDAVTPFWNVPYEEQLLKKQDDIHKFLMKLSKDLGKVNRGLYPILKHYKNKCYHQCCPLSPVIPSPVKTHYRNKCEFTIGRHLHTKEKTVGFRLNAYKEGSMSVAPPDDCINISKAMLQAVKCFEAYVRESNKDVYNPENHQGYWRQLTVRTSNNSDILLIVVMHPQSLSETEIEEEKVNLKNYFSEGHGSTQGITSVFFQLFSKRTFHDETADITHLTGKKYLEETLLNMKFQVSPEAFFQINVPAAEVLYTLITKLAATSPNTVALDICCGTGSISLCLAKAGLKTVGIEMCPEAVENARLNAKINNLSNVEFVCGKAEDVIIPTLNTLGSCEIVAVVDPPRAGLHQKVLKTIRANAQISKLIYVSCNPNVAYSNFVDLCRATSNNYKGSAFYPVLAEVVDMFPYTPHKELVLFFKRVELVNLEEVQESTPSKTCETEKEEKCNSETDDTTKENVEVNQEGDVDTISDEKCRLESEKKAAEELQVEMEEH